LAKLGERPGNASDLESHNENRRRRSWLFEPWHQSRKPQQCPKPKCALAIAPGYVGIAASQPVSRGVVFDAASCGIQAVDTLPRAGVDTTPLVFGQAEYRVVRQTVCRSVGHKAWLGFDGVVYPPKAATLVAIHSRPA